MSSLDLSKLSDAVTKVAGIAQANANLAADIAQAQKDVDALTASLIAATSSPAGAVGLAAVSAALAPAAPAAPVSPSPDAAAPVAPVVAPAPAAAPSAEDISAAISRLNQSQRPQ
jgi:hypothetical protein